MRILLTNDDGINAPGLAAAEAIAAELAGPDGEVWVVAPAFEQSGVAHAISYTGPTMIAQLGPRRFAAEGSPADCVLAAVSDAMGGLRPDFVLSGVNRGNNSGENAAYSGTLGAAMEAALQGLPAIALSQYLGPRMAGMEDPFDPARRWGAEVVRRLLAAHRTEPDADYQLFYNVNFPPVPTDEVRGLRVAPQGRRRSRGFTVEPFVSPTGRRFLWVRGGAQDAPADPGSDVTLNMEGWISVTPMRADFTCHASLGPLAEALGAPS
ncbi:5'/3'-nucleotidase SurE [Paracoccus sp. S-4012]|uniref:5'/3'-nucleotidase SurE n=1 Tax=Paracoccus sp. S-4012 TaxID=2665648 RepID=UPI0012AF3340|nr:5'/3'-nucleotidase SurE [Paracoccus sp. S-4012]MRX49628.1 5'/3'-nucleotidase SurE [Paracoccus sp. S-4012]